MPERPFHHRDAPDGVSRVPDVTVISDASGAVSVRQLGAAVHAWGAAKLRVGDLNVLKPIADAVAVQGVRTFADRHGSEDPSVSREERHAVVAQRDVLALARSSTENGVRSPDHGVAPEPPPMTFGVNPAVPAEVRHGVPNSFRTSGAESPMPTSFTVPGVAPTDNSSSPPSPQPAPRAQMTSATLTDVHRRVGVCHQGVYAMCIDLQS